MGMHYYYCMNRSGMNHSGLNHSGMNHSDMNHSGLNHSDMNHSGIKHVGMNHAHPRSGLVRGLIALVLAVGLSAGLTGCGDPVETFKGSEISGTHLGQGFQLTSADGKPYTLASFAGKAVLVFFGYTQCPDVCPTTLAELSQVMKLLGDKADRLQVVMITVDPERDTPEILKGYATSFDPRFLGLSGTPEQIKQAASSFKAYYAKNSPVNGTYSMDHTASFYLIDPKGESRVLLNNNAGAEAIAHDVRLVLR